MGFTKEPDRRERIEPLEEPRGKPARDPNYEPKEKPVEEPARKRETQEPVPA